MSKTVDDLVRVFEIAHYGAANGPADKTRLRAGIAAVVRALRDEFGRIMYPGDDWNRQGILEQFDQILGAAGDEVATQRERMQRILDDQLKNQPLPPAADPAPTVCGWRKVEIKGPLDPNWWSDCARPYDYERSVCGCGKPIRFVEGK